LIDLPRPEPLFNPFIAPPDQALTPSELLASPFGLLVFIPLVPCLRLAARTWPRGTLIVAGLLWMIATVGPRATLLLLIGCLVASGWVVALGRLLRSGYLSPGLMLSLVWLGLLALAAPWWWFSQWEWYGWQGGSRLAVLHSAGIAYFLLRLIAWGVDLSRNPSDPLRPVETLCWLLYPPCMRLGPVLLRREFLERFETWKPAAPTPWKHVVRRFGLFLLGGFLLVVVAKNSPVVPSETPGLDFLSSPESYSTSQLMRVFYFVPIQVYLLLWVYNELAVALSVWVGIRVDNNFDWLPRATSVRDFWRRWHVTVGRWLRNYIYLPLGGSQGFAPPRFVAVFGFCAIWHGASWSFLAWGMSQALALTVQRWWDQLRTRLGWRNRPSGRWWIVLCWLATMHFQAATILVFMDFEHCGWRIFRELWRRLLLGVAA
jgi:D-alanyl-lipoteichoic acid acyltransferase DltB (MBOAT superfamily)